MPKETSTTHCCRSRNRRRRRITRAQPRWIAVFNYNPEGDARSASKDDTTSVRGENHHTVGGIVSGDQLLGVGCAVDRRAVQEIVRAD